MQNAAKSMNRLIDLLVYLLLAHNLVYCIVLSYMKHVILNSVKWHLRYMTHGQWSALKL